MRKPQSDGFAICSICQQQMPLESLTKHFQRKHAQPAKQSGPAKRSEPIRPEKFAICPQCGLTLQPEHLPAHLSRHAEQAGPPQSDRATPRTQSTTTTPAAPADPAADWYRDEDGNLEFGVRPSKESRMPVGRVGENKPSPVVSRKTRRTYYPPHEFALPVSNPDKTSCSVCGKMLYSKEIRYHAQEHSHWCPICHKDVRRILKHLETQHDLQPIRELVEIFLQDWRNELLFTCLRCNQLIALSTCAAHRKMHQARLTQAKASLVKHINRCPVCNRKVLPSYLEDHLEYEHPRCPVCSTRVNFPDLPIHLATAHPESKRS